MTIPKDNSQLENARRLRSEMTPHERKLWYLFLRKYPVKVYKQRIIGRFIVDFYCASAKLVIELDGSQHYEPQGMAYDSERSAFLTALGLEVLRFSNQDVDMDFRGVCTQIDITIQNACKALSVTFGDSSPRGRAKGEGGRCNCAVCHNSIKKRSASARMRSVNCLTNAPLSFRGVFGYPLSNCSYSSCGRRRPTAENDTRAKSSVSRARPRMSSQVTAS